MGLDNLIVFSFSIKHPHMKKNSILLLLLFPFGCCFATNQIFKRMLMLVMVMHMLSHAHSQNPIRFFERVPTMNNIPNLGNVHSSKGGYNCVVAFLGGIRGFVQFDSIGHILEKHYIDTLLHPDTVIDFGLSNYRLKYLAVNGDFYFPTFKFYLYSPFYNKKTPCLSIVNTEGYLIRNYDYTYNNPAEFTCHTLSADNKILACGRVFTDTITGPLICDALVTKLDTNGNELWRYRYTGPYAQDPGGIIATPDSGAIVALASGPWPGVNEVRVIKLSKSGQLQWMKKPPLPIGIYDVHLIDYDALKKEVVLLTNVYKDSMIIGKYDSSMHPLWEIRQRVTDSFGGRRLAIIQMIKDRNGYIGCGVDQRAGTGADVIGWLYKIDSTGKPYWENTYNGKYMNVGNQYNTSFFGIDTTDDGGYIIGGSTMDSLHNQVGVLLRTDEFGCLIDQCDTRYITGFGALSNRVGLGLSLFPNPANSHVTLTLDGVEINKVYHYSITGTLGELLREGEINKRETELDIRALSSGMYVVQVFGNRGERWCNKFVKE
jgi:hypothetical protein